MLAVELFVAMQTRKAIEIPSNSLGKVHLYSVLINGMIAEDGSGTSWIVQAYDIDCEKHINFYVRTTDKGKSFGARVIHE